MLPVFVISLTAPIERRQSVVDRLNAFGIPFEFLDAVDGRERIPPEFGDMVDRWRD